MVMARALERRVWVMNRLENVPGTLRAGGFEAVQVAAAAALRPGQDWVVPYERDLALCLALGLSPLDVMLALFGREGDPSSGGRQSPGDFGLRRARLVTTSGAIGTQVVHAAGIAYASRLKGLDEVTLCTIGERGTDTGDWHEGLNFAAVHRLPLICLVEDDSTPVRETVMPGRDPQSLIARRAPGYGMAGDSIDAGDFELGLATIARAVERARSGGGPTLVHARGARPTSLAPRGTFRSQEDLEGMTRRDPIERMRRRLQAGTVLDELTDDHVRRDCSRVVEAAVQQARAAASPEPAAALDNVFGAMHR
jgi:2-oxoisovalerate dehydrogenase E1 component alpha subunit